MPSLTLKQGCCADAKRNVDIRRARAHGGYRENKERRRFRKNERLSSAKQSLSERNIIHRYRLKPHRARTRRRERESYGRGYKYIKRRRYMHYSGLEAARRGFLLIRQRTGGKEPRRCGWQCTQPVSCNIYTQTCASRCFRDEADAISRRMGEKKCARRARGTGNCPD